MESGLTSSFCLEKLEYGVAAPPNWRIFKKSRLRETEKKKSKVQFSISPCLRLVGFTSLDFGERSVGR